jgi:hypothetical protein
MEKILKEYENNITKSFKEGYLDNSIDENKIF